VSDVDLDLTVADLEAMSPDEIDTARRGGRLDRLLGHVEQLTKADIGKMSAADVLQAQKRGAFDSLLGRPAETPATDTVEAARAASRGSADQGARTGGPVGQLSREHLRTMDTTEISKALRDGRLDDVLGRER
jgi:hypothetical protein